MRDYIQINDSYIFDLSILREALFTACDGTTAATLKLCLDDDAETAFFDDEAITSWHRLRDALARRAAAGGEPIPPAVPAAIVLWHPESDTSKHMEQFESDEDARRFLRETGGYYTPIDEVRRHPAAPAGGCTGP